MDNRSGHAKLGWTGTTCESEQVRALYGRFRFLLTTVPARQFTMMTQSTVCSGPPKRKDQDMGGFPGPIDLFLGSTDRTWNRIATYWQSYGQHRYLSWLPDSIDGLIIGRNSEFYTDGLTDEQLEHLGGIEYRALRFLSYFVFAVSAETNYRWLSLIDNHS